MEKKQIILPSKRFFRAPEEDLSVRVNLDESENLLREGDKNIVLDIAEQFNKERNECKRYKINGKIKMVFRNMYHGNTDYEYLKNNLYLVNDGSSPSDYNDGYLPYDEFAFLRQDVLREVNRPYSGSSITLFSDNISLLGPTGHTTITPMKAPYQNWNLYLSYVYSGITNYPLKYTLSGNTTYDFTSSDGIPFRVQTGTTFHTLTSPVEHGLSSGEYIILSGGTFTGSTSGRTFYVESVGNETYNSEKYVINLVASQFASGTTFSSVVIGKRCLDINNITGTTSQYYVHKHKILTTSNDYILDKIGFESPIWEDEKKLLVNNYSGVDDFLVERNRMESVLYDFKEPFVLTGLTNNLNYTPTELYVSIIFRNGNGYFDYPPKVGYRFNFHDTWIDNHFSGITSLETSLTGVTFTGNTYEDGYTGFTFISGQTLSIGDDLIGAYVEYNPTEIRERIISESFHKITNPTEIYDFGQTGDTTNFSGATVNNPFGIFYQPHHRVKIREMSPYIETSTTDDIYNFPENAKYFQNENVWKWRDIYDHGFTDQDGNGTNYPYVNNIHYIKKDINFYLKNEARFTNKNDGLNKFKNRFFDC